MSRRRHIWNSSIQSRAGTLYKGKRDIKWRVLHPGPHRILTAQGTDGLQLADSVPAAFFQAVNVFGMGDWDPQFAKMLKPRIATEYGTYVDYGVALQPPPLLRKKLTSKQRQIFQFYGYRF